MQYRLVSALAASVLMAVSSAAPVPVSEESPTLPLPPSTISLGKPSTVITWGKRDTISLGKPSTDVTWEKSSDTKTTTTGLDPPNTITLGKPSSTITWGGKKTKRDDAPPSNPDEMTVGQPDSTVIWGKRGGEEEKKPKDSFHLGDAETKVTWS